MRIYFSEEIVETHSESTQTSKVELFMKWLADETR